MPNFVFFANQLGNAIYFVNCLFENRSARTRKGRVENGKQRKKDNTHKKRNIYLNNKHVLEQ